MQDLKTQSLTTKSQRKNYENTSDYKGKKNLQLPYFRSNHPMPTDTWTDSIQTNMPHAHLNSRELQNQIFHSLRVKIQDLFKK